MQITCKSPLSIYFLEIGSTIVTFRGLESQMFNIAHIPNSRSKLVYIKHC